MSTANTDRLVSSAIQAVSAIQTDSKLSLVCASIIFFLFSTRFHLQHRRQGFRRTQNRSSLNLHIPNQGCQVFTTKPTQLLLKTSPIAFRGGFPGKTADLATLFLTQDRRVTFITDINPNWVKSSQLPKVTVSTMHLD